ncbi:MAG TPA: hypothetical protein P5050_01145 [Bacteroidia bacterium]|nr:hypothetical protein [Bacteroidia bacterium]HRS57807.1 hypothetical protein [Bacteroidia bacterium]HRU67893.1 hypothetical protein [Bacteroidia bacterium]
MLRKTTIFTLLNSILLFTYGQNKIGLTLTGGTFSNYSFSKIYLITDGTSDSNESCVSLRPFYSFQAGLCFNYYPHEKFFITTGFNYVYRYIDINLFPYNVPFIYTGTKLQTFQIPLKAGYILFRSKNNLSAGLSTGINISFYKAENQEFGKWQNTIVMTKLIRDGFFYTLKLPKSLSPEWLGSIDFGLPLTSKLNLRTHLFFTCPFIKNLGHELFYYKRIDTSVIADKEFTFYERDIRVGLEIDFEFRPECFFNCNK